MGCDTMAALLESLCPLRSDKRPQTGIIQLGDIAAALWH